MSLIRFLFFFFSFSFFAFDRFFKKLTDLEFFISNVRLFHSFMHYRKKVLLKDFVIDKRGLLTETDTDLKR